MSKIKNIEDLKESHLLDIANIATDGQLKSKHSSNQKEIETGGYGKRRLIEWVDIDRDIHHFEIDHSPLPENFPQDLKKNSNPHDETEILQKIKLNWNQRGKDITVSAQEHFFKLKEKEIARMKKDRE